MIKTKNILKGKFLNLSIRIGKELDNNSYHRYTWNIILTSYLFILSLIHSFTVGHGSQLSNNSFNSW